MSDIVELSPTELRKMQLIILEMMVEIDRICKKNDIRYSLDGGTMLGAVRHKGFIPWDDDADLIMERCEYERFVEACKHDLDENRFFFQEYRTDPHYRWGYAKMRRKGTEYVRIGQEHLQYVTGVSLDIFPEDHVPDGFVRCRVFYFMNYMIRKALYSELGKDNAKSTLHRWIYRQLYRIPREKVFAFATKIAADSNAKDTKMIIHTMYPNPSKATKYGLPFESVKEFVEMEFEGLLFPVSANWEQYLTLSYGDYMTMPPEEERVSHCTASCISLIDVDLDDIRKQYYQRS